MRATAEKVPTTVNATCMVGAQALAPLPLLHSLSSSQKEGIGCRNKFTMGDQVAAPFVVKTYQMVSDRRTDSLIKWGKMNNSFVVVNPSDFSQFLLPCYFKHSNFSSFVRQLNTYGFRKVDPDRWEFAHRSFLKGQTHLLPHVTRRSRKCHSGEHASASCAREKTDKDGAGAGAGREAEQEILPLLQEIYILQKEQRVLDEELRAMSKRLQDTERRPQRMISFLIKLAGDPRLLSRLLDFDEQRSASAVKKKRLLAPPSLPLPSPCPTQFNDGVCSPSILMPSTGTKHNFALGTDVSEPSSSTCNSGSEFGFPDEFGVSRASAEAAAAFPFCLLGHGFY